MKILLYSSTFYPSIGGLETVMLILAREFHNEQHEVKVISYTSEENPVDFGFEIVRKPHIKLLIKLLKWCDFYFQGCVSLKGILPNLLVCKPIVIAHHNWYCRLNETMSLQDRMKHFVSRFATNISVSHAVANVLATPSTVIPNPYQDNLFQILPEICRDRELIFLGRLVSDKGVDLLLVSLANLKQQGLIPKLTIVGLGPEEPRLRQQVEALDLVQQVEFVGAKVGRELVILLNTHKIMVVPSRWQEPFGIVALEGIACGCVIVGSEGGGLKDAIGSCGVTFANCDDRALTQTLKNLLKDTSKLSQYRQAATPHLARHKPKEVAKAYLKVFEEALR